MNILYKINGQRGDWRLKELNEYHAIFWRFANSSNRRVSVKVPKKNMESMVMQVTKQRINLSQLESLRGE